MLKENFFWSLIVCKDLDGGIGISTSNSMAWSIPEDLIRFRKLTTGNVVVMGRKTLQSIGHPLPKRHNVVLSREYTEFYDGTTKIYSNEPTMSPENLNDFFNANEEFKNKTIWVIGGSEIYNLLLPYCNRLYITEVKKRFGCDVIFPTLDETEWQLTETSEEYYSDKESLTYYYKEYIRK